MPAELPGLSPASPPRRSAPRACRNGLSLARSRARSQSRSLQVGVRGEAARFGPLERCLTQARLFENASCQAGWPLSEPTSPAGPHAGGSCVLSGRPPLGTESTPGMPRPGPWRTYASPLPSMPASGSLLATLRSSSPPGVGAWDARGSCRVRRKSTGGRTAMLSLPGASAGEGYTWATFCLTGSTLMWGVGDSAAGEEAGWGRAALQEATRTARQ